MPRVITGRHHVVPLTANLVTYLSGVAGVPYDLGFYAVSGWRGGSPTWERLNGNLNDSSTGSNACMGCDRRHNVYGFLNLSVPAGYKFAESSDRGAWYEIGSVPDWDALAEAGYGWGHFGGSSTVLFSPNRAIHDFDGHFLVAFAEKFYIDSVLTIAVVTFETQNAGLTWTPINAQICDPAVTSVNAVLSTMEYTPRPSQDGSVVYIAYNETHNDTRTSTTPHLLLGTGPGSLTDIDLTGLFKFYEAGVYNDLFMEGEPADYSYIWSAGAVSAVGLYQSKTRGTGWIKISSAALEAAGVTGNDFNGPGGWLVSNGDWIRVLGANWDIWKTDDGGLNWSAVTHDPQLDTWFINGPPSLISFRQEPGRIYAYNPQAGYATILFAYTDDDGANWHDITGDLPGPSGKRAYGLAYVEM